MCGSKICAQILTHAANRAKSVGNFEINQPLNLAGGGGADALKRSNGKDENCFLRFVPSEKITLGMNSAQVLDSVFFNVGNGLKLMLKFDLGTNFLLCKVVLIVTFAQSYDGE